MLIKIKKAKIRMESINHKELLQRRNMLAKVLMMREEIRSKAIRSPCSR
jgi:hypothetical protein